MELAAVLVMVTVMYSVVDGQMTKIGKCPDVKMMTGFEMSMLEGEWDVVMKIEDFSDLFVRCVKMNFKLTDPERFDVEGVGVDMVGNKYTNAGIVTKDHAKNSLRVQVPSIAFNDHFKVVHVNPKSVSISFNCVQTGEWHSEYIWIFARTPRISNSTAEAIKGFVARRGIDISKLKISTDRCPV